MGIDNLFGLVQACLYFVLFILAFFICVPTGLNVSDFKGHCLLGTTGEWQIRVEDKRLTKIGWGSSSACNFTIFLGVISLVMSAFYVVWLSIFLARGLTSSWLDAFVNLIVNCVFCICFFSTALTVSIGFQSWCNLITSPKSGISKCENGQYIDLNTGLGLQSGSYFTQWNMVQFSVWLSWITWLTLSVMSLVRLYKLHRQEAFFTSVGRERQRLLQRVGHSPQDA